MECVGQPVSLAAAEWLGLLSPVAIRTVAWVLALIGHVGLWCVVFNRIHATALPRRIRKQTEKIIVPIVVFPVLLVCANMAFWYAFKFESNYLLIRIYLFGCVGLGVFFVARWVHRRYIARKPEAIKSRNRVWLDLQPRVKESFFHGSMAELLGKFPLNEVTKLTLEQMTFGLSVSKAMHGFKICQLSDLHFTGHISIEYFQAIVEEANRFEPDLIVITGDFIDDRKCLTWFESTVGRLKAKYGVYYVLGNHDKRIQDEPLLRQRLEECGLIAAAGQWHLIDVEGSTIALTGNELPWFDAVNQLPMPSEQPASDLAILLSHSPDQIDWATSYKFDLMFAGHTHGGQIAFPVIGPIVAPSKYGVKYASGTFQVGDTLMHVSRGISGDEPIRVNSPPELGQFVIERIS